MLRISLRRHDDSAGSEAAKFLRNAAQQKSGKPSTAAPPDNNCIYVLEPDGVDNRLSGIAPDEICPRRGNTRLSRPLLGILKSPSGRSLSRIDRVSLDLRELRELLLLLRTKRSADCHDRQCSVYCLHKISGNIDGTVRPLGPVRRYHDVSHFRTRFLGEIK